MKLLLSAYACEPDRGSEPGVGWNWATWAARQGHQVWVITRANNRPVIEAHLARRPIAHLQFEYYDLPAWAKWWKHGLRGLELYYMLWQWGAYRLARKMSRTIDFDWVHHITFGVHRQPSFMGRLGIPFVYGPLGGGDRAPVRMRRGFPLREWIREWVRDVANRVCWINPLVIQGFRHADVILCKTSGTMGALPSTFRKKARVQLEIGINADKIARETPPRCGLDDQIFKTLFVGRLIYLKGPHLALKAFAQLSQTRPHSAMTMIGGGPNESRLKKLAADLGVDQSVRFTGNLSQSEVLAQYAEHDVFLFPSLRDSSGNVVLESLSQGLPVIVVDLGGPATIAGANSCRVVGTAGLSADAVAEKLGHELINLACNPELRLKLGNAGIRRAHNFEWDAVVRQTYAELQLVEKWRTLTAR